MVKQTVKTEARENENKRAEATLKCLIHKARATKLALGKYCAK